MMLQPSSLSPWFFRDKNKKNEGIDKNEISRQAVGIFQAEILASCTVLCSRRRSDRFDRQCI